MEELDARFSQVENAGRIGYLIGGFLINTNTIEEREELDAWIVESDENMLLFEDMTSPERMNIFLRWLANRDVEAKLAETKARIRAKRKAPILRLWPFWAAAASLIVFVIVWQMRNKGKEVEPTVTVNDIAPGSALAELILPDNKKVLLRGSDTTIGSLQVKDGMLDHRSSSNANKHELVVPRKGTFRLRLPDGTTVWLNAESRIEYPGAFESDKREVMVDGEAYFEIAKDPLKPFIVSIGNRKVIAVGTAFNVNSFDGSVTLTEGKVNVSEGALELLLKPGEQLNSENKVVEVDTTRYTGWTRNMFYFRDMTIDEIKPLLERWYDAEINIQDSINYHFNLTIERSMPISRVLKLLQATGQITFSINGKTVTVTK